MSERSNSDAADNGEPLLGWCGTGVALSTCGVIAPIQPEEKIMLQTTRYTTPQTKKSDVQVQQDVYEELKWDTRVEGAHVGVEVQNGMVVLSGHVESYAEREAAQEAAYRVNGVLDVANEIVVKIPGSLRRDDVDILAEVRRALACDVLVPHEKIRATVSDGIVTLEGMVDFWSQHEDAGRAIRNLTGVRRIKNLVAVEPPLVPLQTLRSALGAALERQAADVVAHVQIAVSGANVTLKGRVPTAFERRIVEDAIRKTPGVKAVENKIEVQSDATS